VELVRCDRQCGWLLQVSRWTLWSWWGVMVSVGDRCRCLGELCGVGEVWWSVCVTVAGVEVNFVELARCDGQCGGDCCRCWGELYGVGEVWSVCVTVAGVEVNFVELVRCDGQCGDCCRCRGELCGVGEVWWSVWWWLLQVSRWTLWSWAMCTFQQQCWRASYDSCQSHCWPTSSMITSFTSSVSVSFLSYFNAAWIRFHGQWRKRTICHFSGLRWEWLGGCVTLK